MSNHFRIATDSTPDFSDIQTTAKRNSVIILNAGQAGVIPRVHAANANVKLLAYKNSSMMNPWASGGVTTGEAEGHESWWLHNPDGSRQVSPWSAYLANIGNPDYQQRWVENVLAQLRLEDWDGVFMDDVNPTPNVKPAKTSSKEYPTDAAYQAAVGSFLAYACPKIQAAGKLVCGNVGNWGFNAGYQTVGQRWVADHLDLVLEEHWNGSANGWQIQNAQWTEAHGKVFLGRQNDQHYGTPLEGFQDLIAAAPHGCYAYQPNDDYHSEPVWLPEFDPTPPPPDAPPTIRITKPAKSGKAFSKQLTIQAEASADTKQIELLIDDEPLIWLPAPTANYLWRPGKKVKLGKHMILVRALDAAGQSGEASIWVRRTA